MNRSPLLSIALRFAVAYVVLLTLSVVFAETWVSAVLPLFRWELMWLLPDFRVIDLSIVASSSERLIALHMEVARPVNLGGLWPAGAALNSSTLLGHVLQPAVLALSILCAWPVRSARARGLLLLCGAITVAMTLLCDVPVVLAGAIVDVMVASSPYPPTQPLPLAVLMNFLNGGGRLLLAFVAVFGALLLFAVATPSAPMRRATASSHFSRI